MTAVTEIARHYELNEINYFTCIIAAWFHDIGYYKDLLNHEETGAKIAESFLVSRCVDEETVNAIKGCIMATKFPQSPKNLLEKIVCDADFYHFGTDDFPVRNKLMKREAEAVGHVNISKAEWRNSTILLLKEHQYYTDYCKNILNKKKKQHLEHLKKKVSSNGKPGNPLDTWIHDFNSNGTVDEDEKVKIPEQPERGTETLFRIASGVSQRLNEQADTKAHILISVNAIIISVFLSIVVRKIEMHNYLTIPVTMFLTVNLLTIIFSILATRPSVPDGFFNQDELNVKQTNLLFFGNFYNMDFEDYSKGMLQVIGDKHFLYLSLIRNLYDQGKVLGKKYRLLKLAYNIFMVGIVVSVIAFLIAAKHDG